MGITWKMAYFIIPGGDPGALPGLGEAVVSKYGYMPRQIIFDEDEQGELALGFIDRLKGNIQPIEAPNQEIHQVIEQAEEDCLVISFTREKLERYLCLMMEKLGYSPDQVARELEKMLSVSVVACNYIHGAISQLFIPPVGVPQLAAR